MSAAPWDIEIEQGADWEYEIQWDDDDGPVDVTGWTAMMQIRNQSDVVIVELSTENGGIIIDEQENSLTLFISAATTSTMSFRSAFYDLKLISPDALRTYRLLEGQADIDKAVTR